MATRDTGSSGGGDSDSGSTTDSTTTDSQVNDAVLSGLGLGWLAEYDDVLKAFGKRPVQFVAGAIFTLLLNGVESIVESLLGAVLALGDAVAAVPTLSAEVLTSGGAALGTVILDTIRLVNEPLLTAAQAAGPLAPVIGAAIIVAEIVAVIVVARAALRIILDLIPGIGGLA